MVEFDWTKTYRPQSTTVYEHAFSHIACTHDMKTGSHLREKRKRQREVCTRIFHDVAHKVDFYGVQTSSPQNQVRR